MPPPAGTWKLNSSPCAILNAVGFQLMMDRSVVALIVPKLPAPVQVTVPLTTVNGWTVGLVPTGTTANSEPGSMADGPTANIAMNSLRSDNLTGGAFFICDKTSDCDLITPNSLKETKRPTAVARIISAGFGDVSPT